MAEQDASKVGGMDERPGVRQDQGPYLILTAFWSDRDVTDLAAAAVRGIPSASGFKGASVAFRYEVADSFRFRDDMRAFNLEEVNERPASAAVPVPDTRPDNQDLGGKQSLPCGGES